jgi:hypothetical protein
LSISKKRKKKSFGARMVRAEVLEKRNLNLQEKNTSDFRLEYGKNVPDSVLIDDVISYLGEYRFSLPKYKYELKYLNGKLRDPHRLDPMENLSQRAIDVNLSKGRFSTREQAEKTAFQKLDQDLKTAKYGDTIVWISPPGPKEEGYGDYGFVFLGKVQGNGLDKRIKMTAIRVNNLTIEQSGDIIHAISGKKPNYKTAEGYIANPSVLPQNLSEEYVDSVLGTVASFRSDPEEQRKFQEIITRMYPLIAEFIHFVKDPAKSKEEKIKGLYSLENLMLQLKREYDRQSTYKENVIVDFRSIPRLGGVINKYGYKPPEVKGSCPSVNKSSNLLSANSFINKLLGIDSDEDQKWFHCPECDYQAHGPIGNTCPNCKLTKEKYAKKTGSSCS